MMHKLNVRNLLAFVILALAAGLTAVVVVNFRRGGPEELLEALPKNIDLALKEVSYTESENGSRRWTLLADAAAHSVQSGIAKLENIRMTFFDPEGVEEGSLQARQGAIQTESREVEVQGEVVLTSPRGYIFYTDELRYNDQQRMIFTEAPVRLVSGDMQLRGTGLRFHVGKNTFELLADVNGRLEGLGDSR